MKKQRRILTAISLIVYLTLCCNISSGQIIYVDDDAGGINDGSSWENAYIYLQDALAEANSAEKPVEIRVAHGVYTPDKGANVISGDNSVSFELINGVTLTGGYAGLTTDPVQGNPDVRDFELYETILSGDLLGNDADEIDPNNLINEPTCFDNSFHVVQGSFTDKTAVLDGFTITAGNAGGYYLNYDSTSRGGGCYIEQGNPIIMNCTLILNAAYEGGAIYSTGSDPNIINCRFIQNSANYYDALISLLGGTGGAIYNNQSSPFLTDCEFIENLGGTGGGIYNCNVSNAVLTGCIFTRNTANLDQGGGLYNSASNPILKDCNFCENYAVQGGGIANVSFADPEIENCIFTANHSEDSGGAIYNRNDSEPNITNCIFIENSAYSMGGAIANESADPNINNCTFTGNRAYYGGGFDNNSGNPMFISCTFTNNSAANKAGAIQNFFGDIVLKNCIFSGNKATSGGAILNSGGNISFTNCTLFGNYAQSSGHIVHNNSFKYSPILFTPGNIDFLNCIIWNGQNAIFNQNNTSAIINYCDVQYGILAIDNTGDGLIWGDGNIDVDPCFVQPGLWADVNDPNIIIEPSDANAIWLEGDYHLKSAAGHYDPNSKNWILDDVTSLCIDAGDPNSLFTYEPLPNGVRINMGAYGGTPQASMSLKEHFITHLAIKQQ